MTGPRQTHTFAELGISAAAYDEIRGKLEAAGYQHAFMEPGAIDMHGIGVTREPEPTVAETPAALGWTHQKIADALTEVSDNAVTAFERQRNDETEALVRDKAASCAVARAVLQKQCGLLGHILIRERAPSFLKVQRCVVCESTIEQREPLCSSET